MEEQLEINHKFITDERDKYQTALSLLADVCDKNTLKINEILNMLNFSMEKYTVSSPLAAGGQFKWMIASQSKVVEDLVKRNQELGQDLKRVIIEY